MEQFIVSQVPKLGSHPKLFDEIGEDLAQVVTIFPRQME